MRVSKNQVTLLSAAVAALFAAGAQAQIVLASANPTVTAVSGKAFASELAPGTVLTAPLTVNTILGIGTSSQQNRYIRFRLTNASFNAVVLASALTTAVANQPLVVVSQFGTAGSNNVIFQITSPNAGNPVNEAVSFNISAGVNIVSTAGAATITYEVYEFLAQAQAGTPVLYTATGNVATFSPAVVFRNTGTATTQTATAISSYLNVAGGQSSPPLTARVAQLDLANGTITSGLGCGAGNNFPCQADGVLQAGVATVLNSTLANVLSLTGDFSAAASAASITVGTNPATAFTPTSASITLTAAQAAGFLATNVNYLVNGTTPIPISTYTALFTGVANPGYAIAPRGPITTGQITRDGVQYESPWVTATTGFISRFFLTQTTPATVPYTVVVRNAAGPVTGGVAGGTLGANRQTLVTLASLLPADTTAFPGPYQVTFNVASDASVTMGSYVLTSPNGAVSNVPLFRAANR